MSERCQHTGKILHLSANMALTALLEVHQKRMFVSGPQPVNFYQCPHCRGWHLTSSGTMHPELKKMLKRYR
jgi:Zn-finger nucleic acid-binding protein